MKCKRVFYIYQSAISYDTKQYITPLYTLPQKSTRILKRENEKTYFNQRLLRHDFLFPGRDGAGAFFGGEGVGAAFL